MYEGDTVASTATYLSSLSVRGMQVDEYVMEIAFREEDDPPDSPVDCCPNES